jgi:pimeloyl-ACP methyl ester carboxylesterase
MSKKTKNNNNDNDKTNENEITPEKEKNKTIQIYNEIEKRIDDDRVERILDSALSERYLSSDNSLHRELLPLQIKWKNGPGRHSSPYNSSNHREIIQRLRERNSLTPQRRLTFLYFHGNHWDPNIYEYAIESIFENSKHGILCIQLNGYIDDPEGEKATEASVLDDARASVDYIINDCNVPIEDVVFVGYSMGTYIALRMALEYPQANSAILFSPIKSLPDAANFLLGLPVPFLKFVMNNKFASEDIVAKVNIPIFMFHGVLDQVLPLSHGEFLYDNAINAPFRAFFITQDDHFYRDWKAYWKFILEIYKPDI